MEFIVIIPTEFNDGSPVPLEQIAEITDRLGGQFEGTTIVPNVSGVWVNTATEEFHRDPSLRVYVSCNRLRFMEARDAVIQIGRELKQEAMYFEVRHFDGAEIIPITGESDNG